MLTRKRDGGLEVGFKGAAPVSLAKLKTRGFEDIFIAQEWKFCHHVVPTTVEHKTVLDPIDFQGGNTFVFHSLSVKNIKIETDHL